MSIINAVAYYRMSTDKQEDSIARQRSQLEPYAERNGYRILRDYIDEGIAGDEEEKRKAFMQLMKDAKRKEFAVILVDDKDRLMRFDSITQGYYVKQLRDAGARLETCSQGRIDLESFAGRITDCVLQESKKLESQANSRRVMTRMLMMANEGKWLGGPVPHGLKLIPDPVLGKRLVPGEPADVRVVRLIFELYANGYSMNALSRELAARGVRNPSGGPFWSTATLKKILRNRKYIGDMTWNSAHCGKYTSVSAGQIKTTDSRAPGGKNALQDWIIKMDLNEGIVSRELFLRVQERLSLNRKAWVELKLNRTPVIGGGQYTLAGLLVCGNCGARMIGMMNNGQPFYRCASYHHYGKRACSANMVLHRKMLDCVVRKLQEQVLNPACLEKVRQEMRQQIRDANRERPERLRELQKQIAVLDRKIGKGIERLTEIDKDLLRDVSATVRAWKEEREKLQRQMDNQKRGSDQADMEQTLDQAEAHLWHLREAIEKADPMLLREVIREFVSKIELHFEKIQAHRKIRSPFKSGVIFVRPQSELESHLDTAVGRNR